MLGNLKKKRNQSKGKFLILPVICSLDQIDWMGQAFNTNIKTFDKYLSLVSDSFIGFSAMDDIFKSPQYIINWHYNQY